MYFQTMSSKEYHFPQKSKLLITQIKEIITTKSPDFWKSGTSDAKLLNLQKVFYVHEIVQIFHKC